MCGPAALYASENIKAGTELTYDYGKWGGIGPDVCVLCTCTCAPRLGVGRRAREVAKPDMVGVCARQGVGASVVPRYLQGVMCVCMMHTHASHSPLPIPRAGYGRTIKATTSDMRGMACKCGSAECKGLLE